MNDSTKVTTIECKSCGAHFDEMLSKCPYCGAASVKGAEAEYMDKLEDVRSDMEDLGEIPEEETKKEFKKQGKFVVKLLSSMAAVIAFILIASYFLTKEDTSNRQSDYAWQQENIPILDELYEQEKYDELLTLYNKATEEEAPIYTWEHSEFCSTLQDFLYVNEILIREKSGEPMTEWDYQDLLYYGFQAKLLENNSFMTQEDKQKLTPYTQIILEDFETRWDFTEEERIAFEEEADKGYGFISYQSCKEYIEKWMKRSTKNEM